MENEFTLRIFLAIYFSPKICGQNSREYLTILMRWGQTDISCPHIILRANLGVLTVT